MATASYSTPPGRNASVPAGKPRRQRKGLKPAPLITPPAKRKTGRKKER